jgi:undecaprenyl-diphosphatase
VDARIFKWFNRLQVHTPWAHGPATAYAVWGIGLAAALLAVAWWDARSAADPPAATASVAWAGVAALIGVGLVQVIGGAVDRARPTTVLHGSHLLLDRTADFSFPSDHLTAMSAVAAGLFLGGRHLRRSWYGWAAAAAAGAMALVRVYVGAHYLGDVLGGVVLGAAVAIALDPIGVRALRWAIHLVASTPLRPLVADRAGDVALPPAGSSASVNS